MVRIQKWFSSNIATFSTSSCSELFKQFIACQVCIAVCSAISDKLFIDSAYTAAFVPNVGFNFTFEVCQSMLSFNL